MHGLVYAAICCQHEYVKWFFEAFQWHMSQLVAVRIFSHMSHALDDHLSDRLFAVGYCRDLVRCIYPFAGCHDNALLALVHHSSIHWTVLRTNSQTVNFVTSILPSRR
jgi:hypothetical protein